MDRVFDRPQGISRSPAGRAFARSCAAAIVAGLTLLVGGARPAAAQFFTPTQIRTAYNVTGSTYTGAGQTIAIVDAENDTTALSDANLFSASKFGGTVGNTLPQFNTGSGPTLTIVGQTGSTTSLPTTTATVNDGQLGETSLDIQWAHAVAPQANILLVEANSLGDADLNKAISVAKNYAGVSSVSMSFGGTEYSTQTSKTAATGTLNDATFAAPTHHAGVTFLAATGDDGKQSYPSESSLVLAVGATALTVNASNQRTSEVVWNDSSGSTGSGVSAYEAKPSYQIGIGTAISSTKRINPDVVWNGAPSTGQYVEVGGTLDAGYGGTSISCPQWAGVIALADQERVANGLSTLSGTDAMAALYSIYTNYYGTPTYNNYFYDVTSGTANGYTAAAGYDAASGLGAPNVANIVDYLGTYAVPEPSSLLLAAFATAPLLTGRRRRARPRA